VFDGSLIMKAIKTILILLSLIVLASSTVTAQEEQLLFQSVEKTVAAIEPQLRLDVRHVDESGAVYAWKSSENYLILIITTRPSPKLTQMDFESEPEETRTHGGFDVHVLADRVLGLGDDNYMWETPDGKDKMLAFRKGRYHVRVWALSFEFEKRIARSIVSLIPPSNTSLERGGGSSSELRVLRVSVVRFVLRIFTTETRRSRRSHTDRCNIIC
jgi:hypothetical protein